MDEESEARSRGPRPRPGSPAPGRTPATQGAAGQWSGRSATHRQCLRPRGSSARHLAGPRTSGEPAAAGSPAKCRAQALSSECLRCAQLAGISLPWAKTRPQSHTCLSPSRSTSGALGREGVRAQSLEVPGEARGGLWMPVSAGAPCGARSPPQPATRGGV